MFNSHYYCVIMAGGMGSRFWPISRREKPKQFLDFTASGTSFLRLTYDRFKDIVPEENILVVSLERYKDLVMEHLPELPEKNLLLEPYSRNTAPCFTFATYTILKRDPLAVMVVSPADHVISGKDLFKDAMDSALAVAAREDSIITLGVIPTRPDTNFGYIQTSDSTTTDRPVKIKTFTEKPDVELAQVFLDSGEFYWNSGIFIGRASAIRDELEKHVPEITNLWKGWKDALDTPKQTEFLQRVYSDIPMISIDYGVMEKTSNAWVLPAHFKWADIGNWDSLYEYLSTHDENGNASNLVGKSLVKDCSNNVLYSGGKKKLTAIRGLENYIVIDTQNALLICPRDQEKFKEFLSELAMPEFSEYR